MTGRRAIDAVAIGACVLLCACAGPRVRRVPERYAFDTVSNACRQKPLNCAAMAGKEGAVRAAKTIESAVNVALHAWDAQKQAQIEAALTECADLARSEVLLRLWGGKSPTPQECLEQIGTDPRGEAITRAMQFGDEMHRIALQCAKERLSKLRPGGFSLEQRYRYDRNTDAMTMVSEEEVQSLLRQGRGNELRGTLEPDVVIHAGNPLRAHYVYDFKFPCVNTDAKPVWREYPRGHPYGGFTQEQMYSEALGGEVAQVVPRLGVLR